MPNTVPPNDDDPLTVDVDFDTWALVSAQLLRRSIAERARIIYDSGFDQSWQDIDDHWFAVLTSDIAEGNLERVDRYHAICREHLTQRAAEFGPVSTPLDRLQPQAGASIEPPPGSQTPPFARDLASTSDSDTAAD